MTRLEDRRTLVDEITSACAAGAQLTPACALAGIDTRALQRWQVGGGVDRSRPIAGPRPSAPSPHTR